MRKRTIGLFLVLIALGLLSLIGICLAQQDDMEQIGNESHYNFAQNNDHFVQPLSYIDEASPGIVFHHWQGFAIKGDESYILRVSIEGVRPLGPPNVRRLLASNMTIEKVKEDILAEEGNVTYRGHLKLGESTYRLYDVEIKFEDDSLTLTSDLIGPHVNLAADNSTETTGNIAMNTTGYEDGLKSQGRLSITSGPLIGSYKVLLNMLH